ncbi:hypothetical protein OAE42_05670 [Gammaproteobacteria bacterium]|jgi:hypothetical protein|nr:hypothetical protein [Gammaproteobacteria bacterium]
MEAKILNRGLKLIENFYNASMYTDDVWDNDLYRIKDTIDSLDSNHWKSKQWLVDELIKVYKDDGQIHIAGGWNGLLAYLLSKHYSDIISSDIDPICEIIGRKLYHDSSIKFKTEDFTNSDIFADADVVACTSVEHIDREDIISTIEELQMRCCKFIALQSNNYFDLNCHINCSHSLDEFVEYTDLDIIYKGELNLGDFTRYMVIGR